MREWSDNYVGRTIFCTTSWRNHSPPEGKTDATSVKKYTSAQTCRVFYFFSENTLDVYSAFLLIFALCMYFLITTVRRDADWPKITKKTCFSIF